MDNMTQLGERILRLQSTLRKGEKLVLFKSDVAEAYRLIPMHPIWQTRQINTVDGERYVDRNNVFGGRRSGDTFIAFMSLVLWITEVQWKVPGLCGYVDDVFGVGKSTEFETYERYGIELPRNQARLLQCWDVLGVPHRKEKQLFGEKLTIIGFEVDAEKLTISLKPEKQQQLLDELDRFIIRIGRGQQQKRFTLKEFLQLAGWMVWAFNVYPYLRPSLCHLYQKIGPLKRKEGLVHINRVISRELQWAEEHMKRSPGIIFLREYQWKLGDADFRIFCDASGIGLGFWYPDLNEGYEAHLPPHIPPGIYFSEGLCIVSALFDAAQRGKGTKVAIFTDNEASFRTFSSFHAIPAYNPLLIFAADLVMRTDIQFRVVWTAGKKNTVADALSRHDRDRAVSHAPSLVIQTFSPPPDAWTSADNQGTSLPHGANEAPPSSA
jgi:hypothetical protein